MLLTLPNAGEGKRFGVTVTKKIGNAVVRNRMKRRFRELLRAALPGEGLPDTDHVLIGREGGIERDFAQDARGTVRRARPGARRQGRSAAHGAGASEAVLVLIARGWQLGPSRVLPPTCRYQPTCSASTPSRRLQKHGAIKGGWMASSG